MVAPRIEIIAIGNEVLDGRVIDTNSTWLGGELKKRGLIAKVGQRVDDDFGRILSALELAESRADLVFVTGGLGPTSDDLTAEAFARYRNEQLVQNFEAENEIKSFFLKVDRPMAESQLKQARLAKSAQILINELGTAPGFWGLGRNEKTKFFFFPGVPQEMNRMFLKYVAPTIPSATDFLSRTWKTQFTSEGELGDRLQGAIKKALALGLEFTFRTRFPENHIGIQGSVLGESSLKKFSEIENEVTTLLGSDVFTTDEKNLEECVIEILKSQNFKIGTIESCTGGLVAHRLTNVSGSSEVFLQGAVTYHNDAKLNWGVKKESLDKWGAVSEASAKEMAESMLNSLDKMGIVNSIAVSTTGIAGPHGGSEEKPVGLCYIGLAKKNHQTKVHKILGRKHLTREAYKLFFSQKALDIVRRSLHS